MHYKKKKEKILNTGCVASFLVSVLSFMMLTTYQIDQKFGKSVINN